MRFSRETRTLLVLPFFFVLACQTEPRVQPTSEQPAWVTSAGLQARRSAAGAVSNLKMYPGLEATLFASEASEPRIVNPINLDVDERGRVWVIEVLNYREHGRNDSRPEGDRILILEDLDADGVADTSKVYYQGRDIDAALGIAIVGNRVIVTSAPNVLVFTDEDGDDSPDRKEYLFTRSGARQHDHSTHSFVFGPDGKLYWNMGDLGWYIHDKDGKLVIDQAGNSVVARFVGERFPEMRAKESPYQGGMVFRCNLDGSDFEVLGHNFRNNYEVTVDSFGNLWQSDNDEDGNAGCRINYVMEFGDFGYRDSNTGEGWGVPRTGQHEEIPMRHWHQNDPGVVPNLIHTGAGSPTGITVYEGRLLPSVFWDQVIHCDAGPGVVWAATVTKNGAGFQGKTVDLLRQERDRWVRPVDVAVAPDGSLFVTDWYDPVVGWYRQYDVGRGRVFRVAPAGHPYRVAKFDFRTPEGAVEALRNPGYAVRARAWLVLNEMQEKAESALLELFYSENPRHRARALWLLTKISGRGQKYISRAIQDRDEDIRIVGLRAARQLKMDVIPLVRQLVTDPSPQVRRECALALRHSSSPLVPSVWAELAARHDGRDRWYLEELGIAADGRWDACLEVWLERVGEAWQARPGRDIIWRSRARVTPEYLARIISRADVSRKDTKRYLRAFDFQADNREKNDQLRRLVLEGPEGTVEKLAFVASEALFRMKDLDLDSEPSLRQAVDRVLRLLGPGEQFSRLVQRFELREHYPGLMRVAVDNRDNPTGMIAIRTLLNGEENSLIEDFLLGGDVDRAMQTVEMLANSQDGRAHPLLVRVIEGPDQPWPLREHAVRLLAGSRFGLGALLELAKLDRFPEDLLEVAGTSMTRTMNVRLREEAEQFFPVPPLADGKAVPQMTELLVYVGDPERGKEVFEKAECSTCHLIEGTGTEFGPDLSRIGEKLPKAGLYEAILDPSAGIASNYRLFYFTLRDGREVSGFILGETPDKLTLRLEGGVLSEYSSSDLVSRRESSVSAMPSDLQRQISVDELVDLVEYLTTQQ